MPARDPRDPRHFSESFQFIQSLFQQPEPKRSRFVALLGHLLRGVFVLITLFGLGVLLWLVLTFQLEHAELTEAGLWVPRR
ncbi:hypothetical protein [Reinekea blandensis]|nr:hypothetical protein [Reinekea blandensis]